MRPSRTIGLCILSAALFAPPAHAARAFSVELWTSRGHDAVYRPGEAIQLRSRVSQDAYLIVYEIDAEGYVHLLHPDRRSDGFVEARRTVELPEEQSDAELVVQGPVGQGYIVALASLEPFAPLPWYLRPYDPNAARLGYAEEESDEDAVTAEGRVAGDPFVAMERIRRRLLSDPEDVEGFATAYTSYYVHDRVAYPRYLCNDCHRPPDWTWWSGYDPYGVSCSAFTMRVHWGWYWGPSYWFGSVPYYVYVYRPDCPPRFRLRGGKRGWVSSWDAGRRRIVQGSPLVRRTGEPAPKLLPAPDPRVREDGRSVAWGRSPRVTPFGRPTQEREVVAPREERRKGGAFQRAPRAWEPATRRDVRPREWEGTKRDATPREWEGAKRRDPTPREWEGTERDAGPREREAPIRREAQPLERTPREPPRRESREERSSPPEVRPWSNREPPRGRPIPPPTLERGWGAHKSGNRK